MRPKRRQPSKSHITLRLDETVLGEIARIAAALEADPATGHLLRTYDNATSRAQVVRWAISRAWRSLQAEAGEG